MAEKKSDNETVDKKCAKRTMSLLAGQKIL